MNISLILKLLGSLCLVTLSLSFASLSSPILKAQKNRSGLLKSVVTADGKEKKGGDATIATSTFNLAKSIIGAGVLSLPSGVAFFADQKAALVPSSIICVLFGLVAAYTFSLIGKVCKEHDSTSFQDAWAKSVSPKTAGLISGSITALCFLASLAYSIIIGDSFTSLFKVSLVSYLLIVTLPEIDI